MDMTALQYIDIKVLFAIVGLLLLLGLIPIRMVSICAGRNDMSGWARSGWVGFMLVFWPLGAYVYGLFASNKVFHRLISLLVIGSLSFGIYWVYKNPTQVKTQMQECFQKTSQKIETILFAKLEESTGQTRESGIEFEDLVDPNAASTPAEELNPTTLNGLDLSTLLQALKVRFEASRTKLEESKFLEDLKKSLKSSSAPRPRAPWTEETFQETDNLDESLILAAQYGRRDKIIPLIAKGANVNTQSMYGFTPLMEAAQYGYLDVVQVLLQEGADPNLTTVDGETASSLAEKNGRMDIIEALKSVAPAQATTT